MARGPRRPRQTEAPRAPLFEICVAGVPVSAQAKNAALLRAWKAKDRTAAAAAAWPTGQPPLEREVELRVNHYCERRAGDTDNLIEPIRDALQGVVDLDDKQVKDGLSNWRDINGRFRVRYMAPRLAAASSAGQEFVHIRVELGPVEESLG